VADGVEIDSQQRQIRDERDETGDFRRKSMSVVYTKRERLQSNREAFSVA